MEKISKQYFCPIPFNKMKMKNISTLMALAAMMIVVSCGKLGKSKGLKNDGQLWGVAPAAKYNLTKPHGMVYVPPGTFFFSSRRRHTSWTGDWSSDVCSSD